MAAADLARADRDADASDPFAGVEIGRITFVVHRAADRAWGIDDVVYPDTHTLVWASAGRARYTVDGRDVPVSAGRMLFFPAGLRRSGRSDPADPWTFDSIGFTLRPAAGVAAARLAALPRIIVPPDAAAVGPAVHELDRHWHEHSVGSSLHCRGIVLRLLALYVQTAVRHTRPGPRRPGLEAVVDLLRRNSHRHYPVDVLARRAGLSASRFRVLFRQMTGTSAVKFQNGVRVRRAAGLLRSGEHSVTEVAALVGYQDIFYFSRQFKQITGVPPSAYLTR